MAQIQDVIIIGRGLAGVALSETLSRRGLRVVLFDAPRVGAASRVATGVANPIVLRRTVPSWRASELMAIASAFYRDLEQRYDRRFWHPMPLVEIFPTAQEAGIWRLRQRDAALSGMIGGPAEVPQDDAIPEGIARPYGHGVVQRCAWLDVRALLESHGQRWSQAGRLEEQEVTGADLHREGDGVRVHDQWAPLVVWCTGAFQHVPGLVPVRGEGLTLRIPGWRARCIVHRGLFLVPIGQEQWYAGASFAWEDVWSGPTEGGRMWLMDKLGRIVPRPFEVLDHWSGVRPTSQDRRPIIGRLGPQELVLNGMGSRGVMLAPWCAEHLAAHAFDQAPLDPEVDAARFATSEQTGM